MMRIGGHFHSDDPLQDAVACGARLAQFFLGDPQGWKGPVVPGGDPGALRDAYAAADVDLYIHAPYVINVASTNNRIRIPSRKLLDQAPDRLAVTWRRVIRHPAEATAG